jgi:TRAP transporter TAXI family solute receptor
MIIKRCALLAVCVILALATLLTACSGPAPTPTPGERPQNIELTILGFMAGTTFQIRADAIAEAIRLEYPDWTVTSIAPGGESQLVSKRLAGEGDFFLTPYVRQLEVEVQAPLHPEIDYDQVTAYNLVVPTASQYIHFFALGKTGVTSIKDIVDQKYPFTVGVGPGGSKRQFEKLLEYYGTTMAEAEGWGAKEEIVIVTAPEGVEALQSGRIDMGISWSGIPCPPYMGVTFDLKLLPVDDPGLVEMLKAMGYYEVTIPADTYNFITEDIPTVASASHLATPPEMSEDIVYYTLKALFNHKDFLIAAHADFTDQLTPEAVAESVAISQITGIPFHPGALRFYQEMGWIEQ